MRILMVVAPEGYQDQEYGDPKAVFEAAGFEVVTCSTVAVAHGKFGGTAPVDVLLRSATPEGYEAIVFVGGPGTPVYFDDPMAHALATAFYNAGKITAAICAAPGILANAGLLQGKKVTSFPSVADQVRQGGGDHTGQPVEQDGNLITADGPASAKTFGERIVVALQQEASA